MTKTARHQMTLDLRRKGYTKDHEYTIFGRKAVKVLVYRRRVWGPGRVTHDHLVEIWPDGTLKSSHSIKPELVG